LKKENRTLHGAGKEVTGGQAAGVQEFRSSGVQEFRSSGVQEFRSSGVQLIVDDFLHNQASRLAIARSDGFRHPGNSITRMTTIQEMQAR
jgi:hypothetical protein